MRLRDFLLNENTNEDLVFNTFNEAQDYLAKNFNGHGAIYHYPSKECIITCKCIHRDPRQKVYSKEIPEFIIKSREEHAKLLDWLYNKGL